MMPLDGYFLSRMVDELKILINKRVRKFKMPKDNVIVLEFLNSEEGSLYFDLSSNKSHLRLSPQQLNDFNHPFLNLLKQKLANSILKEISQFKKDRILFFDFLKQDAFLGALKYRLVFETMGRTSHLILLDENKIIIDSFFKIFNDDKRSLLPKLIYQPFPTTKTECSFEKIKTMTSPEEILTTCLGFSKELAYQVFHNHYNLIDMPTTPLLYQTTKQQFHAFDFPVKNKTIFSSLSQLLATYYQDHANYSIYEKIIKKQINSLTNKLANLNTSYQNNSDYLFFKELADAIYMSGLNLKAHYSEFNDYPLNYQLTLNQNAQNFYQKYQKQKRALTPLKKQIDLTVNILNYYQEILASLPYLNNSDLLDLKIELTELGLLKTKKQQSLKTPSYLKIATDNATFYVGKNSRQNAHLYEKIAAKNDLWFHLKDYPGPHVFLKGEKTTENLLKGASLAVQYSKLKNEKNVLVNYTEVKHISRLKKKPGFYLTFKNHKTIIVKN